MTTRSDGLPEAVVFPHPRFRWEPDRPSEGDAMQLDPEEVGETSDDEDAENHRIDADEE